MVNLKRKWDQEYANQLETKLNELRQIMGRDSGDTIKDENPVCDQFVNVIQLIVQTELTFIYQDYDFYLLKTIRNLEERANISLRTVCFV